MKKKIQIKIPYFKGKKIEQELQVYKAKDLKLQMKDVTGITLREPLMDD